MQSRLLAILLVALMPVLARGQHMQAQAQPGCAAKDTALPPDLQGWIHRADLAAARNVSGLNEAALTVGHAMTVDLHPTAEVTYVARPAKTGGPAAYGGLLTLDVAKLGTYRIALGSAAWIDVVRDKILTPSTAHGAGPACSTIHKILDFELEPGQYLIQISADDDSTLGILVWRKG